MPCRNIIGLRRYKGKKKAGSVEPDAAAGVREVSRVNVFIEENELEEVKKSLAKWAKDLPERYEPERKNTVSFTEKEFYTVVKRVRNLEIQNKENAKLKLTDFLIGDILWYLMENKEAKAVLYVDESHEYDVKTNFAHIHGSGEPRIIIIH